MKDFPTGPDIPAGIYWRGIHDENIKPYPAWRYHRIHEPILVKNTDEDVAIRVKGYEKPWMPHTANQGPINWYWDLEDFSPKQLVVYAGEEFGVDLPIDAGQERLFKAVLDLSHIKPESRDHMILMAHTIKMNYDETLIEIRKQFDAGIPEIESQVIEL